MLPKRGALQLLFALSFFFFFFVYFFSVLIFFLAGLICVLNLTYTWSGIWSIFQWGVRCISKQQVTQCSFESSTAERQSDTSAFMGTSLLMSPTYIYLCIYVWWALALSTKILAIHSDNPYMTGPLDSKKTYHNPWVFPSNSFKAYVSTTVS